MSVAKPAAIPKDKKFLPQGDYVSPTLDIVELDHAFPDMVIGDTASSLWPYLRREISHNWYVDRRNPTTGFLSRDEASILYHTARMFQGLPCLEIGCWRGWSTAHFALGSGNLEVIDPVLHDPAFQQDVLASLRRAGVADSVIFHDGASPEEVKRISAGTGKRWSMAFIDGDHEGDAPRLDAETVQRYAADDALILFHDMTSPDVAAGLEYLRSQGWETAIYQTMQIMGVATRGAVQPVAHVPDPSQAWTLPAHLSSFPVIGENRRARTVRVSAVSAASPAPDRMGAKLETLEDPPADRTGAVAPFLSEGVARFAPADSGDLIGDSKETLAFDELRRQHGRLLQKLREVESSKSDADAFEKLRLKHLDLIQKLSEVEFACDRLKAQLVEAERARANAISELGDIMLERDVLSKLLDRAAVKPENFHQTKVVFGTEATETALPYDPEDYQAIRQFSSWMARNRVLLGLSRRILTGHAAQVRPIIEESLRVHRVPARVAGSTIGFLSNPRVIFGLTRRRNLAGMDAVQGLIFSLFLNPSAAQVVSGRKTLQDKIIDLQSELEAEVRRFRALETAKIEDENALLEARLVIAKLRGSVVTLSE